MDKADSVSHSLRLVALLRQMNPVCPIIYHIDIYISYS